MAVVSRKQQIEMLRRVPLFSDLTRREVDQLARTGRVVDHAQGHVVVTEGEKGVGFHLIMNGEARVTKGDRTVAKLGPGEWFGEVSMIDGGPRTATVAAATPLRTFGLASWDFHPLLRSSPTIAFKLLVTMCSRLRDAEKGKSAVLM
jgi:CRP/FNR family transcriptional regulator, cyclic AMP receptor protein